MHFLSYIPIILLVTAVLTTPMPMPGAPKELSPLGLSGGSLVGTVIGSIEGLDLDGYNYVETGGQCERKSQCKSDSDGCVEGVCSVVLGKPCRTTSDCSDQFACSPTANTCAPTSLGEGTSCSFDGQCAWNRCFEGVCRKPEGSYGTSCSSDLNCNSPWVCRSSIFTDGKKCGQKDGTFGSPCSDDSPCAGTGVCKNGACTTPTGCTWDGGSCSTDSDCCGRSCAPLLKLCGLT